MSNYIIETSTVANFDIVIYGTEAISLLVQLGNIQSDLEGIEHAVVLFDNYLYAGNTSERFVQATLVDGAFDMQSFEVVDQENSQDIQQMGDDFFTLEKNRFTITHETTHIKESFVKTMHTLHEALAHVKETFGDYNMALQEGRELILESTETDAWTVRIFMDAVKPDDTQLNEYVVLSQFDDLGELYYHKIFTSKTDALSFIKTRFENAVKVSETKQQISFEDDTNDYGDFIHIYTHTKTAH